MNHNRQAGNVDDRNRGGKAKRFRVRFGWRLGGNRGNDCREVDADDGRKGEGAAPRVAAAHAPWIALGLLAATFSATAQSALRAQAVHDYVAAYNERRLDAMMARVTDDVQWLSIEGDRLRVETDGKAALQQALSAYFRDCGTCRSTLTVLHSSDRQVSAIETAHWVSDAGPRSQRSLSVYEFSGALIHRVYYFPAEP